ncbi:iron complex transport system ATP-binding protein [Eilatimonas milleporae]|uniref:Iron complex transport system ATP-binding protein n=1 Tax=Eilatimonas milleporae TaxID=911205 RepID=A0A3M0CVP1_9PROT|nr:heme ABC transporter ATP-binding protein [Eilatimonas milleporae]RMB07703.1 iron complex transport system ATP-binding protein [Eilatimonas milleporae]
MTLTATDICITRGRRHLVDTASLTVTPGRVTALLGPNGAGKSTLMKVLSGDIRPDSGTVAFHGRSLSEWHRESLARRRAVLMQETHIPFDFSAMDIVLLGRLPHGESPTAPKARDIAAQALHRTGTLHLASASISRLSGGERQRVHLARVLAQIWADTDQGAPRFDAGNDAENGTASETRCLLLDEPTSALDPAYQIALRAILHRLAANGTGVLVILHDLNLAAAMADEIVLMRGGRIFSRGTPVQVLTPDALQAVWGLDAVILRGPEGYPVIAPRMDGPPAP